MPEIEKCQEVQNCHCEEQQRRSNLADIALGTGLPRFSIAVEKLAMTEVEQTIFATIAYYDYFNYPLTAAEIYYYLINFEAKDQKPKTKNTNQNQKTKPPFYEIIKTLDESQDLEKLIGQKNGFCFLAGREEIIKQRLQRKKLADEKFRKSRWILKFISYLPFVRLMMISGTMALGNPYKESDLDLLVVAKSGRIWTARAIITFFALIFGKYRHAGKTKNRLCLNHYITDKSLTVDFGNLYKAQEYLNLLPVSGDLKIYQEFLVANQNWMENYVPSNRDENEPANAENLRFISQSKIFLKIKDFFEWTLGGKFGNWSERFFKKIQIFFIQKNPLSDKPKGRLRYTDDNLVFHPVLIEPEVIERFNKKMEEIVKS
ncbi:hypothetical protein KJ575_00890 [Patescibacteria group bacterium]|nr:hypothetical protein [Patescibacteria group bacterium]